MESGVVAVTDVI